MANDLAGFPNGRRVADDVVTIELRALAGVLYPLIDPCPGWLAHPWLKTMGRAVDTAPGHRALRAVIRRPLWGGRGASERADDLTSQHTVDDAIFHALWRWARRRHPKKRALWVRKKYFCTPGTRQWWFNGTVPSTKGQSATVRLFLTATLPITRHVKVRSEANPYDPADEMYFEERLGASMQHTLTGKTLLLRLWKEQHGVCPRCSQKITTTTGWHAHHIVWRSKGGSDKAANRVLLHPTCHQRVHSQGLTVVKPRPPRGVGEA